MPSLQLLTLGGFEVRDAARPLTGFESNKVRLLLVYLALESGGRAQTREHLAALLWPEHENGRLPLRRALSNLRKTIGDHSANPPFLLTNRQTIQLNAQADIWFDADALLAASRQTSLGLEELETAVSWYKGELLQGFHITNSLEMEEWLLLQREILNRAYVRLLQNTIACCLRSRAYERALPFARKLVTAEPWQEEGHRKLMRLLVYSGQRSAALVQFEACRQLLRDSLGVEPEKETIALYEQIRQVTLPVKSGQDVQMPVSPFPVFGREDELNRLKVCLQDEACRLITLTGPGGVGKTRLAVESVVQNAPYFSDGAFFVPLVEVTSRKGVVTAVSEQLGLSPAPSRAQQTQLFNYLADKQMLIVLDNFEQLIEAASLVGDLVQVAPKVTFLVTSRVGLNLWAEQIFPLAGLPVPENGETAVWETPALQLFATTAQKQQPDWVQNEENARIVAEICRMVDGLPLAILLAASWIRVLSVQEILTEIKRGLDMLAADWPSIPARHRTFRGVVAQSWRLLTNAEKEALAALSVFAGGFMYEAAQAVTAVSLHTLRRFVNHSLVVHSASGRFFMHRLLHQFTKEKLAENPAAAQKVAHAHARYYCQKVAVWHDALKHKEQKKALLQMQREHLNISLAWQWAARERMVQLLAKAAGGYCLFFNRMVRYEEGLAACETAVPAIVPFAQDNPDMMRLMVLLLGWQTQFARRLQPKETAVLPLLQAKEYVNKLQALGEPTTREMGWFYMIHGRMRDSGQRQEAFEAYQASAEQFHLAGDAWAEATALAGQGSAAWNMGNYELAAQCHQLALQIRQRIQDLQGIARTQMSLGMTWLCVGRFEEAVTLIKEGSDLRRELGDRRGIADALRFLGIAQMTTGSFNEAATHLRESVQIYEELGLRFGLEPAMLGSALAHLGQYDEALAWIGRGLALAQETGYRRALGYGWLAKGEVLLVNGRLPEAVYALVQSVAFSQQINQQEELCRALAVQTTAALLRQDEGQARVLLNSAQHITATCHAAVPAIYLLVAQAAWHQYQGEQAQAARYIEQTKTYDLVSQSRWFADLLAIVANVQQA